MYIDIAGNLIVQMPDVDVKCPICEANDTVSGDVFCEEFLEPIASAQVQCRKCDHDYYVHIKN